MGVEAARNALADAAGRRSRRAMLLFATADPGVPRQDERHRDPRRARPRRGGRRVRRRRVGAFGRSARCGSAADVDRADARRALRRAHRAARGRRRARRRRRRGRASCSRPTAPTPTQAQVLGRGAATLEFLDRWRLPGERASHVWEERFGEHAYVPLAQAAFADACKAAGVDARRARPRDRHRRALPRRARRCAKSLGVRPEALVDDLTASIGNTGAAHSGHRAQRAVLERAAAGPAHRGRLRSPTVPTS